MKICFQVCTVGGLKKVLKKTILTNTVSMLDQPLPCAYTRIGNDVGMGDGGGAVALVFTQNEILDKWLCSPTINGIKRLNNKFTKKNKQIPVLIKCIMYDYNQIPYLFAYKPSYFFGPLTQLGEVYPKNEFHSDLH